MMKICASKLIFIYINLLFIGFLFVLYMQPHPLQDEVEDIETFFRCTLRDCSLKKAENGEVEKTSSTERLTSEENISSFFNDLNSDARIGLVNIDEAEAMISVGLTTKTVTIRFDRVQSNVKWDDLFPEWIDEEKYNPSSCPELPMPDFSLYGEEMDVVVGSLPCRWPEAGWTRDVHRLQVHLVVANLAARKAARDRGGKVRVALKSECRPMTEIFKCDGLVKKGRAWWVYEVEVERLKEVVSLPVGSCNLALDFGRQDNASSNSKWRTTGNLSNPVTGSSRREAYATVLHSSDSYVCGAIVLAQSIINTGSTRDLILLHDDSIPRQKLRALSASGWRLRRITRIRNPHSKKSSYNEYNYSKLRLWQLADYDKVIFVDADLLILHNIDFLFQLPEISAVSNSDAMFNSGMMVIEPSGCTFEMLMGLRRDIISYNGGDQGFLNEVFPWWHQLSKRVNFLTFSSSNRTSELIKKNYYFGSDPVKVYGIHYLGFKPWACYRDYDCNWNRPGLRMYANDAAHWRWWAAYDQMDDELRGFCALSRKRKESLERDREMAEKLRFEDEHWKLTNHIGSKKECVESRQ